MIKKLQAFNTYIESNLNTEQKKAVTSKDGIFLVVAGAGSGKTRVITSRIAHLIINEHVDPASIVALTFTNKAAREMSERIETFLEHNIALPFLGTFHSYCLRILRQHKALLKHPFAAILDDEDQQTILKNLIKKYALGKRVTARKLSFAISQIKNSLLFGNSHDLFFQYQDMCIREMYAAYEKERIASQCLDFDDLLIETVKLFDTNKTFKKEFQQTITHILVDEYQDTNMVQHALLKHMALDEKNRFKADSLCIVGDEDQSIYSWRGATIENIVHFKKDFPQTKIIKIEQNYRSVQPILDAANSIITHNKNRNEKRLWSNKNASNRIKVISCLSEYQEGDIVASFLKTVSKKNALHSVAILYRAHYQSRSIEEALIRNSIPYKIIGGIQFYERKEIKDILAYLRLVVNPFDRASFFRVINCPTRNLGAKFEEQFYNLWNQEVLSDFKIVAKTLLEQHILTKTKQASLINFLRVFDNISATTKPSDAITQIITATGYLTYIKQSYDQNEAESRIDNVKELIRATKHMEEGHIQTISQFLDEVALMQSSPLSESEEKDSVTLMTLHAAKGLEFETIIIVGLEEGLLPISRALTDTDALEEERRLFYVGITRAKERLLLSFSNYRYSFGQTNVQAPSRFLKEIPDKLLSPVQCSRSYEHQIAQMFAQWLGISAPEPMPQVFTFNSATTIKKPKAHIPIHSGNMWQKNRTVKHKTFGVGIIQHVEQRSETKIYITAKFKDGIKKIDAKFLTKI